MAHAILRKLCALFLLGASLACNETPAPQSCVTNNECRGGEICLAGICQPIRPGQCISNADCTPGEYCDTASGECLVRSDSGCRTDADCPREEYCEPNLRICLACFEDTQCPRGEVCRRNMCVAEGEDAGIALDAEPFPDAQTLADASSDTDAGSTNADAGGSMSCMMDNDCGPPQRICEANQCVLGCSEPGGLSCGADEVCDTNTGRCVQVAGPCTSDRQCNPPLEVCEGGQCVPGCGQPGGIQCAGSTVCDTNTGRCVMSSNLCTMDSQCNPPSTICNQNNGQCEPGCLTTGCTSPEICNMTTGRCEGPATCVDDSRENNDSQLTATILGASNQLMLTSCPSDDDYYAITLNAGDQFSVSLTFTHAEGNIDLQLLDATGAIVAESRTNNNNEALTHSIGNSGTYTVRVFMVADNGSSPGNNYELNTSVSSGNCMSDPYEPNNTAQAATTVTTSNYTGLWTCTSDDDVFTVQPLAGESFSFDITFIPSEGEIRATLYDFSGAQIQTYFHTGGRITVNYTSSFAGRYYLKVWLASDSGTVVGNAYGMNVTVGGGCNDDLYEDNDTASTATPMNAGSFSNLRSCLGDDDYYEFNLSAGTTIAATITFRDAEGDLDLRLYSSGGTNLRSSSTTTDDEQLTYTINADGTYRLKVEMYRDDGSMVGNTYGLVVIY